MTLSNDPRTEPVDTAGSDLSGGSTASPCTSVCQLDADNLCIGCGRTIDEIMGWPRMSAPEKAAANRRAADRRQALGIGAQST